MLHRRLGRTKLSVSVIGLGCYQLRSLSWEKARTLLERAVELGINFFDTARNYGQSEDKIGKILRDHRDDIVISTKVSTVNPRYARKQIDTSLKKLGKIDILSVHGVNTSWQLECVLIEGGLLDVMKSYRDAGKIGFIGITGNNPWVLTRAIETLEFDVIMFPLDPSLLYPYNTYTQTLKDMILFAEGHNLGMIAMQPFSHGVVLKMNLEDPLNSKGSVAQLALSAILSAGRVHSVIPGTTSIHHLEENCEVGNRLISLEEHEIEHLSSIMRRHVLNVCRECWECMPCPYGVDIPNMFKCLSLLENFGMARLASTEYRKYKNNKESAEYCVSCGECEKKCPFHIPISKEMSRIKRLFSAYNGSMSS